ncbi:hypothetical protein D918_09219 [Trichuris suis]|nr:hypothetical protein D918_09219 [Trichuris suis]
MMSIMQNAYRRDLSDETIGYQCLHFKRRSKEGYENYSPTFCMDDRALADIPWTVLSVTDPATFVACSYAGHYVSKEERAGKKLCYGLSTDCHHTDQLIKTTFYCQTGELLNVLQFGCLASWKEDEYYFDYVKLHDSNRRGCFTSRLHKGKLYVIWTGKECQRNVDFEKLEEEYDEKLIILSQKKYCTDKGTAEDSHKPSSCDNPICPPTSTALQLQRTLTFPLYIFISLFLVSGVFLTFNFT